MEKWIVVSDNWKKRFPSEAEAIYIANVDNFDKFDRHLMGTGEYAYKLSSYECFFSKRYNLSSMRTVSF